jgi:Spy/CpxP family protein refolding chaperone
MNRTFIRTTARLTAALFLAVVLSVVFVTAQETQAPPPAGKKPAAKLAPGEALGLTPEQEKSLEEFRKARREEGRAFRDEMMKVREEMRELAKDPKANQAKIDALIDRSAQLRAGREKAAFRNRAERDKIFSPEQLEKMKAFRGRLMGRPGLAGPGRMGLGRVGMRGPGLGRFGGPRFGLRPFERLRALRHRQFLRWHRR